MLVFSAGAPGGDGLGEEAEMAIYAQYGVEFRRAPADGVAARPRGGSDGEVYFRAEPGLRSWVRCVAPVALGLAGDKLVGEPACIGRMISPIWRARYLAGGVAEVKLRTTLVAQSLGRNEGQLSVEMLHDSRMDRSMHKIFGVVEEAGETSC